jgi:hypothetical protein
MKRNHMDATELALASSGLFGYFAGMAVALQDHMTPAMVQQVNDAAEQFAKRFAKGTGVSFENCKESYRQISGIDFPLLNPAKVAAVQQCKSDGRTPFTATVNTEGSDEVLVVPVAVSPPLLLAAALKAVHEFCQLVESLQQSGMFDEGRNSENLAAIQAAGNRLVEAFIPALGISQEAVCNLLFGNDWKMVKGSPTDTIEPSGN